MQKRKRKYKIVTKGKSYDISQSPLYKLCNQRKLAAILNSSLPLLRSLRQDNGNYNVFSEKGSSRVIQNPTEKLDKVHSRIASLICRIHQPNFIHSGRKGCSHVSNAEQHLDGAKLLTTDIRSFFQSTKKEMVFKFFTRRLLCSPDVSALLSDICTYDDHIPTGSRISMPLAYWSNFRMFDELQRLSNKHDVVMTLYVDDLTFSGKNVTKLFLSTAKKIIERHKHQMHPTKTNLYMQNDVKVVTGVVIKDGRKFIKNEQHKKIYQDIETWMGIRDIPNVNFPLKGRLLGRLNSLSSIEPRLKDKARTIVNYKPKQFPVNPTRTLADENTNS